MLYSAISRTMNQFLHLGISRRRNSRPPRLFVVLTQANPCLKFPGQTKATDFAMTVISSVYPPLSFHLLGYATSRSSFQPFMSVRAEGPCFKVGGAMTQLFCVGGVTPGSRHHRSPLRV